MTHDLSQETLNHISSLHHCQKSEWVRHITPFLSSGESTQDSGAILGILEGSVQPLSI